MDLGDNYQYCPYYDDDKAHEKEIQECYDFLESLADYLIWDTGKCAREARYKIEAFLKRMENKHGGT